MGIKGEGRLGGRLIISLDKCERARVVTPPLNFINGAYRLMNGIKLINVYQSTVSWCGAESLWGPCFRGERCRLHNPAVKLAIFYHPMTHQGISIA